MPLDVVLIDAATNTALHTEEYHTEHDDGKVLLTTTIPEQYGAFKVATRSTTGTTVISAPPAGGSIILTDLIVAAEKKSGILTIDFSDGTNTVIISPFYLTDSPVAFSVSFTGRWQGWRNASLRMTTSINGVVSVTAGYIKVPKANSLEYAAWDARR